MMGIYRGPMSTSSLSVQVSVHTKQLQANECSTGELGYDRLNGTRKIGLSYTKSVVYI